MRDEMISRSYNFVILTLDRHAAGPAARVAPMLAMDFPGLNVKIHAAAEWSKDPATLQAAIDDIATADIIVSCVIFLEDQVRAILPALKARRPHCDAMINVVSDQELTQLTRMGDLDMSRPASGAMALLKKLKPTKTSNKSGASQMKMLRRIPKILKLIPGKSQDLRAWFLAMQYWLGGSDANIESMIRFLIGRYTRVVEWHGTRAAEPVEYPECGLYHPDLTTDMHITTNLADLPKGGDGPTIGLLMLRSYILAADTAHYDHVIRTFEARGCRVIAGFAGGLDGRPAIDGYHMGKIDALVSLTGFSLVGGPAYNDSDAAVAVLKELDVPYLNAQPLEFQTLSQWAKGGQGLSPIETTMLIALPELDGATNPTVFAGRHGPDGCDGCPGGCHIKSAVKAMAPCPERIDALVDKAMRLGTLRRTRNADKTAAIVLFGFPPNAGAVGTAAYLSVFESLHNTLHEMKRSGYDVTPPATVDELREVVLKGNRDVYGQEANVTATVSADQLVKRTPWLPEIEAVWGPAPGKIQANGREVFILGAQFGKVFVGVQPTFGYEGDPMRLLFEGGFAPTHAFNAFYQFIKHDLKADVVLHFGMHGALEFMPGKQNGVGRQCWPDRLMGNLPNVYLYAANNPSEATLAKRRISATTVTYLTPPLQHAGLYKGLTALKESLNQWRSMAPNADRSDLVELIAAQAEAVDMDGSDPDTMWLTLLETEASLIPEGLHIVGNTGTAANIEMTLDQMKFATAEERKIAKRHLSEDAELPALMRALSGQFIAPVPGGDVIRAPEILPTGRNIHAFDPFRMPTAAAMISGKKQADELLRTHDCMPRTVALVLWGSDNIKSNGGPIAQALALMGCTARFDAHGRLCGADLVPLAELGRARVDVIMTLSGIFRDLLPLQTKLLADAAYQCAIADEPYEYNPIRAHAHAFMESNNCDMKTAALRVFSNAEGAYGSNVNQMVDNSTFEDESELADAYQARKSFAYGMDGEASQQTALLENTLKHVDLAYQNLESVELGVTSVDHYFDTLGGIATAVKRAQGGKELPVYIGDQTTGGTKVRTLRDQVALETRSRNLNPAFYEPLLKHGHEGVRILEASVTNTMGWSATTGKVDPWVYQRLSETFVLDEAMRKRLADLNPQASMRMTNRLIEAADRNYWKPDAATLQALQNAADATEDQLEGIAAE